jgi:hypothetical protein
MMKRAVLVSVNYKYSNISLQAPLRDALSMKEILLNSGYEEDNILLLSDDGIRGTHYNILESFKWLFSDLRASQFGGNNYPPSTKSQKLVFYYSGHGMQIPDSNLDEDDVKDECLVPLDYITYGVITDDIIRSNLVNKCPSSSSLFCLLDACNSGSGCDLPWNLYYVNGSVTKHKSRYSETRAKVICISAALDNELAYEIQDVNSYSALTAAFVQTYKRGINTSELINVLHKKINKQTPVLSTSKEEYLNTTLDL